MTKPQVRLDADVAEALARVVARRGPGSNLSVEVNRALRSALGLTAKPVAGAGSRAATATARAATGTLGRCPHPPGRRIGNQCAACGATLGR